MTEVDAIAQATAQELARSVASMVSGLQAVTGAFDAFVEALAASFDCVVFGNDFVISANVSICNLADSVYDDLIAEHKKEKRKELYNRRYANGAKRRGK